MNKTDFVNKALRWSELMREIKTLEAELEVAHTELFARKPQTIANFNIKHRKGTTTYDYEGTWYAAHPGVDPDEKYAKNSFDFKKAVDDDDGIEEIIIKSVGQDKTIFTFVEDE